jgi:transglutaminase-like putative cysteine protease
VSRRAFRIDVEDPRPASAWTLVVVASAALWITQQLAVWAVAIQVVAIVVSLWRRTEPFAWQTNPITLNIGMLGVSGATIHVALQGGPATLGLAHFAALAQGLQLIDARPRRTEFLLVALALFQVILASNLTDSVFFPPLLIAFLFAAAWTLMVHTLRADAAEAGNRQSADLALTPSLFRMTLLASSASVAIALVLFVLLPRFHSSVLQAPNLGQGFATSGFSDRVSLGDIGQIRNDSTVVLRVETLEGEAPGAANAYWRGLAFDHFDGRAWTVTPPDKTRVPGSAEIGIWLKSSGGPANLVQRIFREPVQGGVLFGMAGAQEFQGSVHRLERDVNGGLYAAGQAGDRLRYSVSSRRMRWSDEQLRADVAIPPKENRGAISKSESAGERYLQIPELSGAVAALARAITESAETDADRVRKLERYLLKNGRYSDTPPVVEPGAERSPLEAFLFEGMEAHCEYYASALVVLARSVGIPARLVNGFAGGRENKLGGFVELSRSHAHAWVEVHYERAGWVRYDATPPDLRQRAEGAIAFDERVRQLASAMEYWWFQRVVGFDRSDQMSALKRGWLAWRDFSNSPGPAAGIPRSKRGAFAFQAGWRKPVLATLGLVALAFLLWRIRTARSQIAVPVYYGHALRALSRRGLTRDPAVGARDFVRTSGKVLSVQAATAFSRLTESYLTERFGGRPPADPAVDLRDLRQALRNSKRGSQSSRPDTPSQLVPRHSRLERAPEYERWRAR